MCSFSDQILKPLKIIYCNTIYNSFIIKQKLFINLLLLWKYIIHSLLNYGELKGNYEIQYYRILGNVGFN